MTKKKRQRKERNREQKRREQDALRRGEREEIGDSPSPLPDRRAMERMTSRIGRILEEQDFESADEANEFLGRYLSEGGGSLEDAPVPTTPLEQAQELIYNAFDEQDPHRRVEIAKEALQVSGDCADAYVLLAEESAEEPEEAKKLYEEALKAGERALGEETFREEAGHFWGILETRPYMRARHGLALCLWVLGRREEAAEHYRRMLELNPNDNQGVREQLATALVELGNDEELGELLERYRDDGGATWAYTRALWTFRQEGESERANVALQTAIQTNPFAPTYLLGQKELPDSPPELIQMGGESEALEYCVQAVNGWVKTPGALEWLQQSVAELEASGTQAAPEAEGAEVIPLLNQGPSAATDEDLWDLDQEDEELEEFLTALDEAEKEAARLVQRALPDLLAKEPPAGELTAASERLRAGLRGGGWPYGHILSAAGWEKDELPTDDTELWLGATAALISPYEEPGMDPEEEASVMALELADWLGAVVGLVRAGVGSSASPEALVGYINECPEVDGTIEDEDAGVVEIAFEMVLPTWEAAGAIDPHRRLSALGEWGLPRALVWAWGGDFEDGEL
jgi:tetratricopeptide (TPR) repeat protein